MKKLINDIKYVYNNEDGLAMEFVVEIIISVMGTFVLLGVVKAAKNTIGGFFKSVIGV